MELTTEEAASIIGITPRAVVKLCQNGALPGARKHGRDWIIPERSARDYAANRPKPGPKPGQRE